MILPECPCCGTANYDMHDPGEPAYCTECGYQEGDDPQEEMRLAQQIDGPRTYEPEYFGRPR